MSETKTPIPSGWYPDPSGRPQWRVWTGSQWSTVTRPYQAQTPPTKQLFASLHRVKVIFSARFLAPLGYLAGLNLGASTFNHWPSRSGSGFTPWLALLFGLSVFLIVIAWALAARAVRSFQDHWTFWALLPLGNLIILTSLLRRELLNVPSRLISSDLIGLSMWLIVAGQTPWAGLITALIAMAQVQLFTVYLDNVAVN